MNWKLLALVLVFVLLTAVVLVPGVVYAATGQPDKYQYYLSALEALLKGLVEYFKAVIELFKTAIS